MKLTNKITPTVKASAAIILATLSLSGCLDESEESDIPLTQVPANIITVVQNTLPGISLTEAEKKVKKETVIYELEGKLINGKKYEIEIAEDATIIKIELED